MDITVEPKRGLPLYFQLIEQFKHQIATGLLKEGDQLPTVRQLAVDLEINPNTISKAYAELEREGFLQTKQGVGTFVRQGGKTVPRAEREKKLQALCSHFVAEAQKYGFSMSELVSELKKRMTKTQ